MISVIIPVYNAEKYLKRCVESVVAQGDSVGEIILVDDGSLDRSGRCCDLLKNEYPNLVQVVHKDNEGVSATRNIGIKMAREEWIAFVDADDVLEQGMFQDYQKALEQCGNADLLITGFKYVFGDGYCDGAHGPLECKRWGRGGVFRLV